MLTNPSKVYDSFCFYFMVLSFVTVSHVDYFKLGSTFYMMLGFRVLL